MTRCSWILLALMATSFLCDGYKILVIFPLAERSHGILGDGVVRHLLNAGHEVTYITPYPKKSLHENLTQVDVSSNAKLIPVNKMSLSAYIDKSLVMDNTYLIFLMHHLATKTLEHENVVEVLKDPTQQFDLVIAEWMFDELYSGIAAVYGAPFIWVSTVEPHWMILTLIDDYLSPAYNPWTVYEVTPFTFEQRFWELYGTIKLTAIRETVIAFSQHREYHRLIAPYITQRGRTPPSFSELKYNASLVFGNSHVSMGEATRLPQSYKPIGGYHVDEIVEPLPEDLQKLMDESKHGVIYFSMGSNLKSRDFPDQLKKELLQMFGTLKQTVLWKFEEIMADLPKNVKILTWAPQQTILAHPNCVLFITHGGLLSTTETILTGTPIIGIPVFADQFINVKRAVNKGFAKTVSLSNTMAGELKVAIEDILVDPKYSQKVKELSFVFHDRPVKPAVELVHWVEHVIKTGGAPHLRSPALLVPWYQKAYIDLAALVLIVLYVLVKIIKKFKSVAFKVSFIKKIN